MEHYVKMALNLREIDLSDHKVIPLILWVLFCYDTRKFFCEAFEEQWS